MTAGPLDRLVALVLDPSFRRIGARELRALLVLIAYSRRDGRSWPSVGTVAARAGLDRRDAQRALRGLQAAGLVAVVEESRGRRARRYLVLPSAVDGGFLDLHSEAGDEPAGDAVGAGDAPAGAEPSAGSGWAGDAPAVEPVAVGDAPAGVAPADSLGAGVSSRRGGSRTPVAAGDSPAQSSDPPEPPTRARARGSARELVAAHVEDDPGNGFRTLLRRRDQILETMSRSGLRLTNRIRERVVLDQAIADGLEYADVAELAAAARRDGKQPGGLVWHWLEDPHRWRSVLADADQAQREHALRAPHRIAREDHGPIAAGDVAARAGGAGA